MKETSLRDGYVFKMNFDPNLIFDVIIGTKVDQRCMYIQHVTKFHSNTLLDQSSYVRPGYSHAVKIILRWHELLPGTQENLSLS